MLPNSAAAARSSTPFTQKAESTQQVGRFPTYRLLQPPAPNGLRNGLANLRHVKVVHGPSGGRLVLPALLTVHSLEEHPIVFVGGHGEGSVPDTPVGGAAVGVRPRRSLARADHDDFTAFVHANPFNRRKRWRVNLPKLGAQLFDCTSLTCCPATTPACVTPNST